MNINDLKKAIKPKKSTTVKYIPDMGVVLTSCNDAELLTENYEKALDKVTVNLAKASEELLADAHENALFMAEMLDAMRQMRRAMGDEYEL